VIPGRLSTPARKDRIAALIAQVVREHGRASRAQVARLLGLSPSTVGRVSDRLIEQGLLLESGSRQIGRTGRPSLILEFNPAVGSVLAVDLRLTEAYAVRADLAGAVQAKGVRPLSLQRGSADVTILLDLLHRLLAEGQTAPPLHAVVVGAPSIVDSATGEVEWAPSLGWRKLPLGRILHEEFHVPVLVENDVNLAALGEFWKGVAFGTRHMVFVSVGTGIGAGIVIDGKLYHGASHAAGEVSYFVSDINALRDNAGRVGTLEMRVGREGIIRLSHLLAQRYPASRLADLIRQAEGEIRAQEVFSLALEGDPAAQVVFREAVDLLSIVVCNLSVVLDPEVIVLGGPSDWKWSAMVDAIQARIGSALLRPVNLRPTSLGRDAVVLGAVYSALEANRVLPK
jgi:predicted NBD/HSP70 family sugar kinase